MSNGLDEAETNGLSADQKLTLMADHLRAVREIAQEVGLGPADKAVIATRACTGAVAEVWGLHL